jgi:hypothetical protein
MSENGLGALHSSNALPVQDDEHFLLKLDDSGLASCCIWIDYNVCHSLFRIPWHLEHSLSHGNN